MKQVSTYLIGLFFIFFFSISIIHSQVATTYSFSQVDLSYTSIGGTTIANSAMVNMDDEFFGPITIPTFVFDGVAYNEIYIATNGFITFGSYPADPTDYNPISFGEPYIGVVSAFGTDLDEATAGTPTIKYNQVGTEFVVQWANVARYAVDPERISFQVRLDSATNKVTVTYGGTILPGDDFTYPEIGIRGPDATFATNVNNRQVLDITGAWVNSTAGVDEFSTCYYDQAIPSTVPASGTRFMWTPVALDMQVGGLVQPNFATCRTASETVSVFIRNVSGAPIDFALNPVTVYCDAAGPNPITFSPVTINTGILGVNASQTVVISTTYDMTAFGTYTFNAATTLAGDTHPANDGMTAETRESYNPSFNALVDTGFCGLDTITMDATATAHDFDIVFTNSTPHNIPDDAPAGTNSNIVVSGSTAMASEVSVRINSITHTFDGDLILELRAPSLDIILLSNQEGGADENFTNTVFNDTASTPIALGAGPFTGYFQPEDPFSTLTGSANGTWRLNVSDNAAIDVGTLHSWSILIPYDNYIVSYTWSPGTGLSSTTIPNPDAYPTVTTNYIVTATDVSGCSVTQVVNVEVNPYPTVTANADNDSICPGASVTLTGGGASSYSWDNSVVDGVALNPAGTNNYTVIGTDVNGCSNTDMITVTVLPLPIVVATSDTNNTCSGTSVTLNGTGASTYTWDNGVTNNISFNPLSTNDYIVTGTDMFGCINYDTITITVFSLPNATFNFATDSVCGNYAPVTLTGGSPAGGVFTGTGVSGGTFDPSVGAGSYLITYTFTDANGCSDVATDNLLVSPCMGLDENALNNVSIYPNPNLGNFYISFSNENVNSFVSIYNALGEKVYSQNIQTDLTNINLNVSPGMYIVEISNDQSTVRKSIIIQ